MSIKFKGIYNLGKSSMRLQSAVDFITTYGWALLLIIAFVSFLYLFILVPSSITPASCSMVVPINCRDVIVATNTSALSTNIIILLSNSQVYPIVNPSVFINIKGVNTTPTGCNPYFVSPGGDIICTVPISEYVKINNILSGKIYLNVSNCAFAINYSSSTCKDSRIETYIGSFTGPSQPVINTKITISLSSNSNGGNINMGQPAYLYANVMLAGYPLKGAVVNFSASSQYVTINPSISTTGANGTAIVMVKASEPTTSSFTANSLDYTSGSYSINFIS